MIIETRRLPSGREINLVRRGASLVATGGYQGDQVVSVATDFTDYFNRAWDNDVEQHPEELLAYENMNQLLHHQR